MDSLQKKDSQEIAKQSFDVGISAEAKLRMETLKMLTSNGADEGENEEPVKMDAFTRLATASSNYATSAPQQIPSVLVQYSKPPAIEFLQANGTVYSQVLNSARILLAQGTQDHLSSALPSQLEAGAGAAS